MLFWNFFCLFNDLMDVDNLISGSSAFSKSSLNIWKFLVHIHLKPSLENFEHCFASVWNECNCVVVWTFFGIAFLWNWEKKLTFSSPVATAEFPNLLAYWVQHFNWDQGPYKSDPWDIPLLFLYEMTQRKCSHLWTRKQASPDMESVGTLILYFWPSRTVKN